MQVTMNVYLAGGHLTMLDVPDPSCALKVMHVVPHDTSAEAAAREASL